jgi:Flp pilus assembly protein TadD
VLRVHPDDAVTHNCLGVVLARLGRRDEARQEFDAALRLRPDLVAARDNLQRLDREQGRTGDAARRTHATD